MSPEAKPRKSSLELRSADREKVFEKIFGLPAVDGYIKIRDGEEVPVPGYCDRFTNLDREEVIKIVAKNERKAEKARNIQMLGSILEGDLMRANVKARMEKEESKKERKLLKKEYKQIKKSVKHLKKDVYQK